jgi:hypothetical protein
VRVQVTRKLLLACSLSFAFMIVEVVGGFYAGRCAPLHRTCIAEHLISALDALHASVAPQALTKVCQ